MHMYQTKVICEIWNKVGICIYIYISGQGHLKDKHVCLKGFNVIHVKSENVSYQQDNVI